MDKLTPDAQANQEGIPYYEVISTALSNAPLHIRKGDKFFQNKSGQWVSQFGSNLLPSYINILDTNTFKLGVFKPGISVGDSVRFTLRADINWRYSKVKETGRGVVKKIDPGYVLVEVNGSNGRQIHVSHGDVERIDEYYFISSAGQVHKVDVGKNSAVDDYRKRTHNFFLSEAEAKAELYDFTEYLKKRK